MKVSRLSLSQCIGYCSVLLLFGLWSSWLPAPLTARGASQTEAPKVSLSAEARTRIRAVIPAVGLILVQPRPDATEFAPQPRGSAVIVSPEGIVVTNQHVITEEKSQQEFAEILLALPDAEATARGRRYRLRPLAVNRELDLALLKIAADEAGQALPASLVFPFVQLGDAHALQLLDDLVIIGYPEKGGATVTISTGVIEGKDELEKWLKTDARLIHGNSGGAAVNAAGQLIGIPTKVLVDRQPVGPDSGSGSASWRIYGAVGFLRPSYLVAGMLAQLTSQAVPPEAPPPAKQVASVAVPAAPPDLTAEAQAIIQGVVRAERTGRPVAGARVGLIPVGSAQATALNLLSWSTTNADGAFSLNRPVPFGRYTLKAKSLGFALYSRELEVRQKEFRLVIELPSSF